MVGADSEIVERNYLIKKVKRKPFCEISESKPMAQLEVSEQNYLMKKVSANFVTET